MATIPEERLSAALERMSALPGSTVREYSMLVINGANPARSLGSLYRNEADTLQFPNLRREVILGLEQQEAEALVSGFVDRTPQEIKEYLDS